MRKKLFRYIISYNFTSYRGPGFGNTNFVMSKPIRTSEDKRKIEESIKEEKNFNTVAIVSIFDCNKK